MSREFSVPPISNAHRDKLVPYRLEGYAADNKCNWLPISYNPQTQCGSYYFQLEAGGNTIAHVHPGYEEFYVIEGEARESDGTTVKAGNFVSFPPGSYHNTTSENGCLLVVFEWRP
jgi:quercetin dioxygenase-like cupin family protein